MFSAEFYKYGFGLGYAFVWHGGEYSRMIEHFTGAIDDGHFTASA